MSIPQKTIEEIKKVYSMGMPVYMISIKYNCTPGFVKEVISGRYEKNKKRNV